LYLSALIRLIRVICVPLKKNIKMNIFKSIVETAVIQQVPTLLRSPKTINPVGWLRVRVESFLRRKTAQPNPIAEQERIKANATAERLLAEAQAQAAAEIAMAEAKAYANADADRHKPKPKAPRRKPIVKKIIIKK
jgi:hypothetical protein